ncbi:MAG: AMP-binding protein [Bradyrhizobium sp.]|uniref:AMP-dependent synthetase/ligase n=1 Tax=Bradyrhizobium sp. TaxID=376 RepID=UPI0025C6AD1F|nr:AMP-binding protein [Bradyrhizobium sp.]MBI5261844.1 AMP-binding protein [Bradyrhizobium sp.]
MTLTMRTLPQILLDRAAAEPDRLVARHKYRGIWREFTYRDVMDHVRAYALGLDALGFLPGETLAIIGENEPENFWIELAALAAGGKIVSLYPDLTPDEIEYLLLDSGAVYFVGQDQEQIDKGLAVLDRVPTLRRLIYWDDTGMWSYRQSSLMTLEALEKIGRQRLAEQPDRFAQMVEAGRPDDIAVLSYTSGTTGRPKGVIITHRYLIDSAHRIVGGTGIVPGMDYLTYIAPAWITEQLFGVTIGLTLPLVVNFPESPEQVLENLREIAVEAMVFAPRQWESLASTVQARMLDAGPVRRWFYRWGMKVGHDVRVARLDGKPVSLAASFLLPLADMLVLKPLRDKLGLTRVKVALCGGSTMAPDVFRLFHAMGVPLRNVYGATEIGILSIHQGERYDLETVGRWLTAHPEAGAPLEWKISPEGELLVRGGSFFKGYYNKPDKTAERLDDDWYRTGDAVSLSAAGELVFLERVDDMRKLRSGVPFPPQFIETRLRFSPFIKDVMILGDEARDYIGALVNIDMSVVSRWAEDRAIGFSTFTDLSQKPEVAALIRQEVAHVNQFLPEHAFVRRFANFPKELDPDEGELTRTRKLRREFLQDRYAKLIDALYASASSATLDIPVTYQDGRRGRLAATVLIHDVARTDA